MVLQLGLHCIGFFGVIHLQIVRVDPFQYSFMYFSGVGGVSCCVACV